MTRKIESCVFTLLAVVLSIGIMTGPSLAATGNMWIGGVADDAPYDLETDHIGAGWSWNAATETLVLGSAYASPILISCNHDDIINIQVGDDVTIYGGDYGAPIRTYGSLRIFGTGRLTLVPSDLAKEYSIPTVCAANDLIFSGATVNAYAEEELNRAIVSEYGDVILMDDARVTARSKGTRGYGVYASQNVSLRGNSQLKAEGEGTDSAGIIVKEGDLTVDDAAALEARGLGEGYALDIRTGDLIVNNDNVTLYADDPDHISTRPNIGIGQIDEKTPHEESGNGGGGGCAAWSSALGLGALAAIALRKRS